MAADPTTSPAGEAPAAGGAPGLLPEGYVPIPLSAGQLHSPLRVCAVLRQQPDPVGGHLVVLRDAPDARVYLGCVVDAGGRVHQWTEVWVQTLDTIGSALAAWRESLSNAALDARWQRQFQAFAAGDPKLVLRTGWETKHPLPLWVDPAKREPVHPQEAQGGEAWRLCTDEALLSGAGLPPFGTSLHRYLYLPKRGAQSPFVPVTPDAPTNTKTQSLESITASRSGMVPLNPGGGLMLIRAFSPSPLEGFFDLLSGGDVEANASAVPHGRSVLRIGGALDGAKSSDGKGATRPGWLFLGEHGQRGRLLEGFHLKLRALADCIGAVRTMIQRTQRPLLNLAADRFQVRCPAEGCGSFGLPATWTAQIVLADPGDAVELPIRSTDTSYFLPGRAGGTSIYRPAEVGQFAEGRCSVRIRKVIPESAGTTVLEGTFTTQERIRPERNDLVRLLVPIGGARLDLFARLESETALAAGEWRFKSVGHRVEEAVLTQVKAAEGVPLPNVSFELLPLLSTPVDLYSLGVIAVRALLVNPQTTLAAALDEVLSLARQLAHHRETEDDDSPLRLRIRATFEQDKRWMQSLGPHRLSWEPIAPEQALDLVPADLWWDALAMIVRMFPGVGPDSTCHHYGDAPSTALHRVFDAASAALESLLVRTRSLIVIDWRYNREIHAVIRNHLVGTADGPAAGNGQVQSITAQQPVAAAPQSASPFATSRGVRQPAGPRRK
jgi:hypothetical protein